MENFSDAQYVNTVEKLEKLDKILMDGDTARYPLLAFDTESNGLEFYQKVVIGFSIAYTKDFGFYVPLLEWQRESAFHWKNRKLADDLYGDIYPNGYLKDVWTGKRYEENVTLKEYQMPEMIQAYLARWTKSTSLVMHNAPFDCSIVFYNTGIDLTENLWCDTILLKHVLDENPPHGLKETAEAWKAALGINPKKEAAEELKELGLTIIQNGGRYSKKIRHVWRGDGYAVAKYAASDAALTMGLYEVGLKIFEREYSPKHVEWFFEKEVMPLCREVVIPMLCGGMYVNVAYFDELVKETQEIMNKLEDDAQAILAPLVADCPYGDEPGSLVPKKAIYEKIMELEDLPFPVKVEKGVEKQTLAKKQVQEAYNKTGHWLFGWILGDNECEYSPERLQEIKEQLYEERENGKTMPRYKFNIRSGKQMRWLLFEKLGNDASKFPQTKKATKEDPEASLAGEVLEEHFKGKYKFIDPIIRYMKLHKMISTYAKPLAKKAHLGFVHMDMRQYGTISGRFACRKPNMQNLPAVKDFGTCTKCESQKVEITNPAKLLANVKCLDCGHQEFEIRDPSAIKKGLIAPEGYKIVNADFESLEPKCFAYMSGDEKLKDVYKQGYDLYSKVYCDMFDPEFKKYSAKKKDPNYLGKIAPDKRKGIKPIVLGIPYGEDDWKVAHTMDLKIKKPVWDKEAKQYVVKEVVDVDEGAYYRNLYLNTYSKLRVYMQDRELEALTRGYVETIVGRRRHFMVAPVMYRILNEKGIELEDFIKAQDKTLNYENLKAFPLDHDDMVRLSRESKIPYIIWKENGWWAFAKHKLKNDLNNAKNFPIQALAAHITNVAMIDISRDLRQNGIDGYVCLQVHDEITVYAKEVHAELAKQIVKKRMEDNWVTRLLDVPMKTEPLVADNLKEAK